MADPVKISELPIAGTVEGGDILPVVDSGLTQTRRCTAAQIAAIGGGAPGDGTVTTGKIANGAVTAPKVGFTGPDKLISRTLTGAGEGVEIPCTSYARGLLAVTTAAAARTYLDALQGLTSPTFSGTLTVNGNAVVTSGANISGGATVAGGMSVAGGATLSGAITANGYPAFFCRAWANIDGRGTLTIRASGGITSASRLYAGAYGLNFSTPMPDANFVIAGSTSCRILAPQTGGNGFLAQSLYNHHGINENDAEVDSAQNVASAVAYVIRPDGQGNREANRVHIAIFR